MPLDDRVRVRHMIEAAQSAVRFCEGMDLDAFRRDERTWRAVVQCIEVIGEAARHVDEQTRAAVPGVPWRQIVGMRHRVAHAYFDVDLRLVWEVVVKDITPLIEALTQWETEQGGLDPL